MILEGRVRSQTKWAVVSEAIQKNPLKSGCNARVFEADGTLGDDGPGRRWNLAKEKEE